MNSIHHYLSIAYDWLLVPPEVKDFDVVLILCSCSGRRMESSTLHFHDPELRVYHAKLPEKGMRHQLSDVSGCLGLLHPVSDEQSERKAAAFERLVSDAILWRLAEEKFHSSEKTVVLLQGPLLPKLRGRLLYRGIAEQVVVCALTHQPEWFRCVEAAEQSYMVLHEANLTGRSAVYPPRPLDRGTRSWVYRSPRGLPLHFEFITNMLDCSSRTGNWLAEIEGMIDHLASHDMSDSADRTMVSLPTPLSTAAGKTGEGKRREESFVNFLLALRGAKFDQNRLDRNATFERIFAGLREAGGNSINANKPVVDDCLGRKDEETLYDLFKKAWPRIASEKVVPSQELENEILVLKPEEGTSSSRKELNGLRKELWSDLEDMVIPQDRRLVRDYLAKVAEDSLRRGVPRVNEVRTIFRERKFSMPAHGIEIFNRCAGKEIIRRIAKETGVHP